MVFKRGDAQDPGAGAGSRRGHTSVDGIFLPSDRLLENRDAREQATTASSATATQSIRRDISSMNATSEHAAQMIKGRIDAWQTSGSSPPAVAS